MMRAQTFSQSGRRDSSVNDGQHERPRSSHDTDGKGSTASAESGEITTKLEDDGVKVETKESVEQAPVPVKGRRRPHVDVVRFAVPSKTALDDDSDSDDDEDMADYFAMEIEKTEVELRKLPQLNLPLDLAARYAAFSHGAMARIVQQSEGLADMLGSISASLEAEIAQTDAQKQPTTDEPSADGKEEPLESRTTRAKSEKMDIDTPASLAAGELQSRERTLRASSRPTSRSGTTRSGTPRITRQADSASVSGRDPGSKAPSTPSQVADDDETESEEEVYLDLETVRQFMATPPLDTLPDYACDPWTTDKELLASMKTDPDVDEYVTQHLNQVHIRESREVGQAQKLYSDNYIRYLDFTMSDDPTAVKSRDKFNVATPIIEPPETITPEPPKPEGRTSGRRFASERDLERVLQASMREDEERKEREMRAQKERYRSEKEAVIPDMYWDAEQRAKAQYTDQSGFTPQDRLVETWQVLAPRNNFSQEENELFEKRYLENPKQWGKIAEVLPHREFGACIQYYYLMKKELNLKEKLRRQPKRRKKGRGKQRSSALVSELGNGDQDGDEGTETGENGERRRPRRAAAPTWGFEQPTTDSETATPTGTPGRRGRPDPLKGLEPGDAKPGRGRAGARGRDKKRDKDGRARGKDSLAVTPGQNSKRRSRSSSRVPADAPPMQPEAMRLGPGMDPNAPPGMQPPFSMQQQPMTIMERKVMQGSTISDVMAAPSLRPEPPLPQSQPAMTTFNFVHAQNERKAPMQASSYWSVSEANDFPHLLQSFGSDWNAIAAHMGSKTAVMVSTAVALALDSAKQQK